MFYLALDLSTKSSGYAVFEDKKLIEYGCITAASTNVWHRIDKMIIELDKILQYYQFSHIYIEDVYPEDVKGNLTVWKILTYLQGFVLHLLDKYNLKSTFLTASEWRSKCGIHTGRGIKRESLKAKDIAFVKNQFGLDVNDDVADAICIGCAALGVTPIQPEVSKTADGFEFG
jgi:Holliday junction resolvasome RuvABC endonuclease subunit